MSKRKSGLVGAVITGLKKQRFLQLAMNSYCLHRTAGKGVKMMNHLKYQRLMMQA